MTEPERPARIPAPLRHGVLFVSGLLAALPARLSDLLTVVMARLVYWRGHALHSAVLQDFRDNVDPTAQRSLRKWRPVRSMYRALVRNANDALWFLTASPERARRRFRIVDPSPLAVALAPGHGAIVVFPHLGSYASLPVVLALNGFPTTIVANRQAAPMQWVMERGAAKAGIELVVVARERGSSITAAMADALGRGRVVAVAGDYFRAREGGGAGVPVELGGAVRSVGAGPALLALRTGAPLVPAAVFQAAHRREPVLGRVIPVASSPAGADPDFGADSPAAVQELSQQIADAMTEFIAREPEQWVMPGGLVSDSLGRRAARR
ncbi:lysophospholipid acyltransferase family protein [Mycolicibacterium brumae]|uniref:Phosphatidylinositol mannoside acyltransferase n=1 Tax=Mycolicibacterium brumae TaxID=85968 RepID=A0A2G5P760_9MYCO|nr:lysophospholipid acyltransferase family protein [Mycolicibacterium brumae]MCV7194590.1 lysophospholipid acyltransferase family protein [Mycolicibacterium brumae]PIB74192.1 hypothetical protein CQY22_013905 [Mycolicibacterium brumae]RWA22972.1 hypothetical protein MBRU_11575 [Mycolicibacterium brumae DSM 44177]UWW08929.1 lysophospholipid acyltransferase family protein [Mycolicibacterium brumae]